MRTRGVVGISLTAAHRDQTRNFSRMPRRAVNTHQNIRPGWAAQFQNFDQSVFHVITNMCCY